LGFKSLFSGLRPPKSLLQEDAKRYLSTSLVRDGSQPALQLPRNAQFIAQRLNWVSGFASLAQTIWIVEEAAQAP